MCTRVYQQLLLLESALAHCRKGVNHTHINAISFGVLHPRRTSALSLLCSACVLCTDCLLCVCTRINFKNSSSGSEICISQDRTALSSLPRSAGGGRVCLCAEYTSTHCHAALRAGYMISSQHSAATEHLRSWRSSAHSLLVCLVVWLSGGLRVITRANDVGGVDDVDDGCCFVCFLCCIRRPRL